MWPISANSLISVIPGEYWSAADGEGQNNHDKRDFRSIAHLVRFLVSFVASSKKNETALTSLTLDAQSGEKWRFGS
jgi:hypothetical protein